MKQINLTAIIGLGLLSLGHSFAQAQTNNTDPVTGIQVLRDAFKVIEDELTERGSQTDLTSKDYQAWNKQFRATLNDALDVYEQEFEAQIMPPLKPLSDRYLTITSQKALRQDQVRALTENTVIELQKVADTLSDVKAKIYYEAFIKIFPFFPLPKFTYLDKKTKPDGFLFINGVDHMAYYHFELGTLGESTIPPFASTEYRMEISRELKYKDDSYTKPESWGLEKRWNEIHSDTNSSWQIYDEKTKKNTEVNPEILFDHYILPLLANTCKTQLCMTLVQQDLIRTYDYLESTIDQPFVLTLPRGNQFTPFPYGGEDRIRVNSISLSFGGYGNPYEQMLSFKYLNPKQPFSD